jgi:hypothetical protein
MFAQVKIALDKLPEVGRDIQIDQLDAKVISELWIACNRADQDVCSKDAFGERKCDNVHSRWRLFNSAHPKTDDFARAIKDQSMFN